MVDGIQVYEGDGSCPSSWKRFEYEVGWIRDGALTEETAYDHFDKAIQGAKARIMTVGRVDHQTMVDMHAWIEKHLHEHDDWWEGWGDLACGMWEVRVGQHGRGIAQIGIAMRRVNGS